MVGSCSNIMDTESRGLIVTVRDADFQLLHPTECLLHTVL